MMRNIFVDDWIDVGKAEGAHDKAVETALALLEDGDSIEKASRISGLPLSEIQSLLLAESVCHK